MSEKKKKEHSRLTPGDVKQIIEKANDDLTLQDVGQLYGITRMRVCQIEKASLRKLSDFELLKEIMA